ncbi:unnamed protein product, partial [Prunus brigantina]
MLLFVLDVIVLWNLLLISIRIVLPLLLFGIDLGLGEWNLPRLLIYQCILEWFSACNLMVILLERSVVCLHWMAPLPNVCKINTDGSRINSSCHIEVGGLLRDSCGSWIKGFSVNLGYGSIIEAELWGLFWGLNMAWDAGFHMVEIKCDATPVVALLKSLIVSTHPL